MIIKNLPSDDEYCGWNKHLPDRGYQLFSGDTSADWVIVGAGFTGLAAARQLALTRPDDDIILLDAQRIADGASGRNSGFLIDLPHDLSAPDYVGDLHDAKNEMAINRAAIAHLRDIVKQEGIECHWRECGKIQGAVNASGIKVLEAYRSGLDKLGAQYKVMGELELSKKLGTHYYKKGLFTPGTVLVHPVALARGLADALPENVRLYEHTPVTEVRYGSPHTLVTKNGSIKAPNLILATNAFAKEFGFFGNALLPVFTYGGMTRPLSEQEQSLLGGDPYWGVIPADPFGTTVRRTPDQRILVRNGFSYEPTGRSSEATRLKMQRALNGSFKARFPMLEGVDIEYAWGGALCLSRNHAPYFGRVRDNVYAAGCHNGLGITKGAITGKLLIDHINGVDSSELRFLVSRPKPMRNPPRPILDAGINMTMMYKQIKAGSER
jgi:glycine/D-amino acid oxidase-like deaminating enzyme